MLEKIKVLKSIQEKEAKKQVLSDILKKIKKKIIKGTDPQKVEK